MSAMIVRRTAVACTLVVGATFSPLGARRGAAQSPPARADSGRPRVVAAEATEALRLDGVLDEAVWTRAEAVDGFVQAEPWEGRPASEKTEVRVAYDEENLYIGARLHDSDPDALVVTDIRKDFTESEQDVFAVILDTF
ncbi:MAG: sugar-binding protein, partial [Gemmatimonadota bacterium]